MACVMRSWAPGKTIICGEHAILYGQPALAGAIKLGTSATFYTLPTPSGNATTDTHHQHSAASQYQLKLRQANWHHQLTTQALQQFYQQIHKNHQQSLSQAQATHLFSHQGDLLLAALGLGLSRLNDEVHAPTVSVSQETPPTPTVHINLTTELVLGGGMGSSAALVAVLLQGLFAYYQRPLSLSQLYDYTLMTEHWQHGQSSGLDPHLCIYGGGAIIRSTNTQLHKQAVNLIPKPPLCLVNTGQPTSSTRECVTAVANNAKKKALNAHFWDQFGQLLPAIKAALCQSNHAQQPTQQQLDSLIYAMQENHRLLYHIGVVPEPVHAFIQQVEKLNGAAKVSGAGSITGLHAGMVLVAGIHETDLHHLCQTYHYTYAPLIWHNQGIQVQPLSASSHN